MSVSPETRHGRGRKIDSVGLRAQSRDQQLRRQPYKRGCAQPSERSGGRARCVAGPAFSNDAELGSGVFDRGGDLHADRGKPVTADAGTMTDAGGGGET